jgi:ribosomal protein L37AE/L43A
MAKDLKALIREITKEVIDEMTTTGAVAGYNTPNAFGKNPNKKRDAARSMPGGTVVGETDTDETTVGENESMTIRRSLEESEEKDRTGMKCEKCHKGTYQETSQFDDADGVLHCTECGISVSRYSHGLNEGRSRYRNFKESDLMRNHAKISYGVNQAKKMLSEVEYLLNICERLKTEANIKNSNLWKRTQPDMKEIHKRLKNIASRIKKMEKE